MTAQTFQPPQIPPPAPAREAAPALRPGPSVSFARLLHVEVRKLVDTLAGRWVLAAIVAATAAVMVILWLVLPADELGFGAFVEGAMAPQMVLLPVLGILAATSEWSKRTALITFTLEPRRVRVAVAKLVAAALVGLATTLAAVLLAAVTTLLAGTFTAAGENPTLWDLQGRALAGVAAVSVLGVAQGVGFGLLLTSTPLAIAAFFLLPQVFTLLSLWQRVAPAMPWIDINTANGLLVSGEVLTAQQWQHTASAYGLWIALPLLLGTWLMVRREVS